jgi:hypothetical protein
MAGFFYDFFGRAPAGRALRSIFCGCSPEASGLQPQKDAAAIAHAIRPELKLMNDKYSRSVVQIDLDFFPILHAQRLDVFGRKCQIGGNAQMRIGLQSLQQILEQFVVAVRRFDKQL